MRKPYVMSSYSVGGNWATSSSEESVPSSAIGWHGNQGYQLDDTPGLSNVFHLGISRNEFTARHTRCTCRCNLMQSRCVIDSNLRRHAFKLHEAFMLIARDLRSGPDSFLSIVSLVRKNAFDIRFRNGWEKLIRSRTKEGSKGISISGCDYCCLKWWNVTLI